MELSNISKYFTNETLDKIIQEKGGLKHTSYEWNIKDGFKKGDSYLSELYRLWVDGVKSNNESIRVSIVVKAIPKNIGRRKTFRSTVFFRNESNFYNVIVKKYQEFQLAKNLSNPFVELPICLIAYCDGENDFIALEDLSPDGFGASPRQNGLDLMHCKIIMETLGRFHALSLAIKDQEPEEFEKLTSVIEETYYAPCYKDWYQNFMNDQVYCARDALSKEYGGTIYETKTREFIDENLFNKMVKLTHERTPYAVIGHGDCWMPNFLMKYELDENQLNVPKITKLIDFQLARYASPVLDISFFIYSCTTRELRDEHYMDLLQVYHKSATNFLKELGSNPDEVFPFSGFLNEMKEFARFGCGMGIESVPFSLLEDSETPDLDEIQGDQAIPITNVWIIKPIQTKEGRLRLADCFKHAVDLGYL